jgi:NADH-quinone oxidoreductase subunit G
VGDLKITVDGRQVEADRGELVIAAAERAGVYIPRFCYHPRMRAVGMCRMCLVNIDTGRGPALTASCIAEVADGMVVDTQAPGVKKAQDGVLEFLLINHPLDCPVCDKGGECPLQDQTLRFGPGESRFVEEKRHYEKPIEISPLVLLDRERCILCDRCTRFSKEVAGDPLIHFFDRGNGTQVNTFPDHPFASYFSGNVVQLCPVGALTSMPYRFTARPWDFERVESTCTSCAVGCRVAVESSTNRITRYQGLDSEAVNQTWLCDRGRFDFGWIDSDERLTAPLLRDGGELVEASWGSALAAAGRELSEVLAKHGPQAVGVIGGARLTNEDCYAWAKLAKGVWRTDNVDAQLGDGLDPELVLGLPPATIADACTASVVILMAPDLKEELPVLQLRLRGAIVDDGLRVIELAPGPTSLSPLVSCSLVHRPGEAGALAAALVADADPGEDVAGVPVATVSAARRLLSANSARVVVVLGRPSLAESAAGTEAGAGALHRALPGATFLPALRRGNVRGALDLGMAPGLLPGRVTLEAGRPWYEHHWGAAPAGPGLDTAGMLAAAAEGRIHALVLLGADPLADFPDRDLARRALTSVGSLIAVDTFVTDSSRHATVVLAAAAYGEKGGTTTNIEGRVTRLAQKVVAPGAARADWMIAAELADHFETDLGFESADDIWDEIERLAPAYAGATLALVRAPGRADGVLVPPTGDPAAGARDLTEVLARDPTAAVAPPTVVDGSSGSVGLRVRGVTAVAAPVDGSPPAPDAEQPPPTGPPRPSALRWEAPAAVPPPPKLDSYSLRLVAGRTLYDGLAVSVARTPALAGLVGPSPVRVNPFELERLGVSSGGTVHLIGARGTLTLPAVADAAVPRGTACLAFNRSTPGAAELIDAGEAVTEVRLETM